MPKVKVKIDNPDENGIGEIIVQGDNVFMVKKSSLKK